MTWSSPLGVDMGPSDQWFPLVAVDPVTGQVGVLYNDRDPSNPHLYDASLTVETAVGPVKTIVSAELSDPTNPSSSERTCRDANTAPSSKGDYITLAYGTDGHANMAWTDMSVATDTFEGKPLPHPRNLQFIFFRRN